MPHPFPDYKNPPVIEVVCGLGFAPLSSFKAVHFGKFWEQIGSDNFPFIQEHPPLIGGIENLGGAQAPAMDIRFFQTPPLPRVWMLDKSGNGIIQIQREAFLHNWRKLNPEDQYPRFQTVMGDFIRYFEQFKSFTQKNSLGEITPTQYELTYINHILANEFWASTKPLSKLLSDFRWQSSPERFLPDYEGVNWLTTFLLPDKCGRLYVSIQTALRQPNLDPIIIIEMKARGIGKFTGLSDMPKWFDIAHEWIVKGFADLTDKVAQRKLWGLKE